VPLFSPGTPPLAVCARSSFGERSTTTEGELVAMSEIDVRRARAGKNQSLFRDVNERIEESTEDYGEELDPTKMFDILCECAHTDCIERIRMTQGEYEALRRVPTHFAIRSGHEINNIEAIVASNERYIVVAKLGAAARAAIHLDPR
jgi:hypothetical protein